MCVFFVSQSLVKKGLVANEWIKTVAPVINGKGGGSKAVAQASGPGTDKLSEAVKVAKEFAVGKSR